MKEIKRDLYLNRLISRRNSNLIKVITGMRRNGKSYLLLFSFLLPKIKILKIYKKCSHINIMTFLDIKKNFTVGKITF